MTRYASVFAVVLVLAATSHVSFGQTLKPGPQVLTIYSDVDDTEQPYALYLPENFDASKKYPLVISLHGAGHNSWENAYEGGQIFDWFAQHRRNPHPDRVRFSTDRYKYRSAHWVRIDALTPGTLASIDAAFTAPNRIEVTTSALDAFTLNLAGHPPFTPGSPVEVRIDGAVVQAQAMDALSFSRREGAWTASALEPMAGSKRPGAEGPMSEALASRHVYVYGTGGDPSREEVAARRAQAAEAAQWSVDRGPFWGRVMVFPRLVADREVRPSDLEAANLVLFGTKETNSMIEQFGDRLPLHLDATATDYGLVYIFPIDGHYVLVNEGLPWWQTADPASAGSPFTNSVRAFSLPAGQDYLLFQGSVEHVVAAGRFDPDWRLPAPDAATLRDTGVVTITSPLPDP